MKSTIDAAVTGKQRWERDVLEPALQKSPERKAAFTTMSGRPIERLYTPEDLAGIDYARQIGDPGEFPYARGIHPTGYRGKLWTMRQFAGFGTPEETNQRYKDLLAAGGTGLSVAFDLPTLMGRDPDHALSLGEVGKCGVNVTSLADMERLFDGIALADITTSMTINSPAPMIFAMYLVVAEKQGADWRRSRARSRTTSSRSSSRRRNTSSRRVRRCGSSPTSSPSAPREVPRWNTISVSGYHIREAGSTALQELAFTLRDGLEYVQYGVDAGLRRRRLRAADLVLLQRAQRLLRGDRQVPGGAQAVGARRCATASAPATRGRGSCGSTPRPPACR